MSKKTASNAAFLQDMPRLKKKLSEEKGVDLEECQTEYQKNETEKTAKNQGNQKEENHAEPHYFGHRKRLRDRFLKNEQSVMLDYELLEMLLGIVQPRKDIKPVAKKLLRLFGSFAGVIGAEIGQLQAVNGMGTSSIAMLKIIHESICRILKERAMNRPLISNGEQVIEYCKISMGYLGTEHNRVLFLNSKNYLIETEMRARGTIDHTHTYPREIVTRALELRAKAIIMVHNHPSGVVTPSCEDLQVTLAVRDAARLMDIELHDHLIVSRNDYYSMRMEEDI